jgi:hypothetical protein
LVEEEGCGWKWGYDCGRTGMYVGIYVDEGIEIGRGRGVDVGSAVDVDVKGGTWGVGKDAEAGNGSSVAGEKN